jgi:adenylosuccinate synthase
MVSDRAHVTMPWHLALDRKVGGRIGTTGRGVGPTYAEKVGRYQGLRIADLVGPKFSKKLKEIVSEKFDLLKELKLVGSRKGLKKYHDEIAKEYLGYARMIRPLVGDVSLALDEALDEGKAVLFEGAQGTLLDIDQGTYPFVTSSNTIAGGVCTGAGIGPSRIDKVVGVAKAYTTRVGRGPLPTELPTQLAELVRERGGEYGVVTGRPRRCGWLDVVILTYARRVNGLDELVLTKLDVLSGIDPLKICTAYEVNGREVKEFPASLSVLDNCSPQYIELSGWPLIPSEEWTRIAQEGYEALPEQARAYVEKIEELVGIPIRIISVGPERELTLVRG